MKKYFQDNNPKRHKIISFSDSTKIQTISGDQDAVRMDGITTIESLREHLQYAIRIEHATIPPYLCALYSIKEGNNLVPAAVIRSVVVEEMLHMVLAANILNAIGGMPVMNTKEFILCYPDYLPHSDNSYKIHLLKFSKEAFRGFLRIEKSGNNGDPQAHDFSSIGQFYRAVRDGLIYCDRKYGGIFSGDPLRQVTKEHYYGSGGNLIPIHSLEDAMLAIDEIVGQGEGIDGTINDSDDALFGDDIEYAHYFRFNEILQEQFYQSTDSPGDNPSGKSLVVNWEAVYNMEPNPKMEHYLENSELRNKAYLFNKTYTDLLKNLHEACNGHPELLSKGITGMYDLKYLAIELLKTPTGINDYSAGPSFEFVE